MLIREKFEKVKIKKINIIQQKVLNIRHDSLLSIDNNANQRKI